MDEQFYYDDLIQQIIDTRPDKAALARLKMDLCKKHGKKKIPKDIEVLLRCTPQQLELVRTLLVTKPMRSASGVVPVAIMSKPHDCPHGRCTYCPGGVKSVFGDVPQSYTGTEPATMRAVRNHFDPYLQVMNRLEYYVLCGHIPQKVELIIMGGTFPSCDFPYQQEFVAAGLQAMNDFGQLFYPDGQIDIQQFRTFFELPAQVDDDDRFVRVQARLKRYQEEHTADLSQAHSDNEHGFIRCVGMTLETRPDKDIKNQADHMLALGATRIELGVQSVYDDALTAVERGHTVADSIHSVRVLKDLGFKVNAHIMPGLPGTSFDMDVEMFRTLFTDPRWRPDMLKIYPCMVMKGTPLYEQFAAGEFVPMDTATAVDLLSTVKPQVPEYVRIMRVQRDIPTHQTVAGVDQTNLRQRLAERMQKDGTVCRCIRCREVGLSAFKDAELHVMEYEASEGREYFLSFDTDDDRLVGFCRMRFPSQALREEITDQTALIRELHVNGTAAALGRSSDKSGQHRGFGRRLLEKAEEIARQAGKKKMVIISGIGVRGYYRKFGYEQEGPYMIKCIQLLPLGGELANIYRFCIL